jgi:hypothetical protein
MEREALLIAEYTEAGHSCRAQESYVRATLSMYLVLAASAAALLVSVELSTAVRAYFCLGAAAVGLCMLLLVLRHRRLYAAFADRARAIETDLGLSLYNHVRSKVPGHGEATAKSLSAFVVGAIGAAFFVAACVVAYRG